MFVSINLKNISNIIKLLLFVYYTHIQQVINSPL